ncbi:hypothetical protein [Bradyrhizobium sp. sGM-13]|uniref:hypothetical protein n=1 Tax=Bradyrhizobium sp. sGM-13 TaxID=2831781 RepID=UPI001BCD1825|nr:hypothetical protein [Bradyrhizobium sp. sGM-13]
MAATPNGLSTAQVPVGTTATQILPARPDRREVTIINHGTTDVMIGGTNVQTTTGALLAGVKGASITLRSTVAIFGIVGDGEQVVSFVETFS